MKNLILFLALISILSSCGSSMRTFSDYDKNVNISNYNIYKWANLETIEGKGMNPLYYNELNDKRIKEAVNREMQSRSFITDNNKDQQLEIHYHILVEDKTSSYIETAGNQVHPIPNTGRVSNYQYREGTLIIDLMDIKTNTLIWRGWATDVVTNSVRKDPEAAIKKAVAKIFEKFPAVKH